MGQIEVYPDHSVSRDFISLVRQLQPPGDLTKSTTFDFDFFQVEKPYESYSGKNVRLRYTEGNEGGRRRGVLKWQASIPTIVGTFYVWRF